MRRIGLLLTLSSLAGCAQSPSGGVAQSALRARAPRPLDASALWTPMTAPAITTSSAGTFVYDAKDKLLVFMSFDNTPQLWTSPDADVWTQATPGALWPTTLQYGEITYDSKTGYVWAFPQGGDGMDEMYWNGATNIWTPMSVYGSHPDGRNDYGAVYDGVADRILFYGGGTPEMTSYSDYYTLDPNPGDGPTDLIWNPITATGSPPSGAPNKMQWDDQNGIGRMLGADGNLYTFDPTGFTKTSATSLPNDINGLSVGCTAWDPGIQRWVAYDISDDMGNNNANNVYEHDDAKNVWSAVSTGGFTGGVPNPGLPPQLQWCQLTWFPPLGGLVLSGVVTGGSTWATYVYKAGWTASGLPPGDMGTGGGGGGGNGGGSGADMASPGTVVIGPGLDAGVVPPGVVAPRLDGSQTYNRTGVVGQPWVPDFSGSQSSLPLVAGTAPFTVSASAGGESVAIDPNTLIVTWIPSSPGAKSITFTVANGAGSTSLTLDVNVIATTLPPPTAQLSVTPNVGPAPLAALLTLSGSAGDGATALRTLIDFGDGSLPSYRDSTTHAYSRVAGYQVTGTFWQNDGQQAGSKFALAVTTAGGIVPPTVTATAAPADEMTVSFTAVAQAGTNPVVHYDWDFGDGSHAVGKSTQHTFAGNGSYSVTIVATDSQSYWGGDKVLVVLNGGAGMVTPTVRAAADPETGDGPLLVTLSAQAANVGSAVSSFTWDFGDNSMPASAPMLSTVQHTYNAGVYTAHLTLLTASGDVATDEVAVMVTANGKLAPQIITVANTTATVGAPYQYDADGMVHARADGPVSYSTGPGAPGGMRVDPQSGKVTWTPAASDVGTHRVTLLATSAGGVDAQPFNLVVTGADGKSGGGCSLAPGAPAMGGWMLALLLLALLPRLRARRS